MNDKIVVKSRVAGYVRVSTVIQAKEGESLDTQRQQIADFCKLKSWNLVETYEDAGVSGSRAEQRPSFMKMINDAESGKFDIILFTKLSRFARNSRDYHNYQHKLDEFGVTLASIKENIDPTSHNGRLMAGIFALLADWERDMIKEQMAENKMSKWRDKRMFNGQAPYGYSWNKQKCEFQKNDVEADILNLFLNWYVSLGMSMRDVVLKLNKAGYRSRRTTWTNGTLSGILSNPCYGSCELITNTREYVNSKRTKQIKDKSDWIIYSLPRIVTKSLWERVEKKREFNIKKQKRTTWQQEYWLRDSLICSLCGGKLCSRKGTARKDGTFPRYYACHWGNCSSKDLEIEEREKCTSVHLIADDLEAYVWDYLCFSLTGSHNDFDEEQKLQKNAEDNFSFLIEKNINERLRSLESKIKRLIEERKKKERANNRILELLENEDCELSQFSLRFNQNHQSIIQLNEEIAETENDLLELKKLCKDHQSYLDSRDLLLSIWSDLADFNSHDKKLLLESLVPDGIEVTPVRNRLGPEAVKVDLVWNPVIFQHLKEGGKFPSLDQYGSDHPAADDH